MNIGIDSTHDLGYSGIGTYTRSLVNAMIDIAPENYYTMLTLRRKAYKLRVHFIERSCLTFSEAFLNPMMFGSGFSSLIKNLHKFK